tara:strand:- start:458 stop:994 length:537 start_codon:yes stop_codon:yes gene_type:complete
MRIDESLKLAADLLGAHLQNTKVPTKALPGLLHRLHQEVLRIQSGTYAAWTGDQDELPDFDVLDQAELDRRTPGTYPPPKHPLAQPDVTIKEKIEGTVSDDEIVCLECEKPVKLMRSHLITSHAGMKWEEYLDRHGLPDDYPATPVGYAEKKRRIALAHLEKQRGGGDDEEQEGEANL